jgi:hypothetical protein
MMLMPFKGLIGFGLPIPFGCWELHQLRKERLKGGAEALRMGSAAPRRDG